MAGHLTEVRVGEGAIRATEHSEERHIVARRITRSDNQGDDVA